MHHETSKRATCGDHAPSNKVPLVLLHGWGVNRQVWQPISDQISDLFQPILLDLPGYGGSADSWATRKGNSLQQVVNHLLGQAPPNAIWVGWSLGATIALAAACQQQNDANRDHHIAQLVLISPTPCFLRQGDWEWGMELAAVEELLGYFDEDYQAGLRRFLMLQTNRRQLVRELASSIPQLPVPTKDVLRSSLQVLLETDLRSVSASCQIPVKIIYGREDRIVPPPASRWLADRLVQRSPSSSDRAESDPIELPGGHLCFLEDPQRLVDCLRALVENRSQ